MLILHTSDWHIGRRFERESLEEDQRAFLTWLAKVVAEERVDLVIVAGDIYDRSLPAEDAVTLLEEGLTELRRAGAEVALISGNHDSARRLGFGASWIAAGGIHLFTDEFEDPTPWVFTASDGEQVAVVAVPFLEPASVRQPRTGPDGEVRNRTHANVLEDALDAGRAALVDLPSLPSIAVAHAFVAGGEASESEKTLAIGGTDLVPATLFAGFDYVALGHLHRPQQVRGVEGTTIAYSGSPLPYSFSETHPKSVRVIEVADGAITVRDPHPIPVGRQTKIITGTLEAICTSAAYKEFTDHWISAVLTDTSVQVGAMDRLRATFPFAVSVRYATTLGGKADPSLDTNVIEERTPEENVLAFLTQALGRDVTPGEADLVAVAVGAATTGSSAGGGAP